MDARGRRHLSRVRAIIKDENQPELALYTQEHPITWRLILDRLSQEERDAVAAITEAQAMPANQDP